MGVVPPVDGFTEGLLRVAHEHGALVVSDEVMTGFRVSPSGWYGLEVGVGRRPVHLRQGDGRWLPAAAFGGRADVMAHAGAGRAGLPGGHALREPGRHGRRAGDPARLHDEVYARLDVVSRAIADAVAEGLGRRASRTVQWAGNMFSVFFTAARPSGTTTTRRDQSIGGVHRVLPRDASQGVYLPPSAFEAWFVSAAHDDEAASVVAGGGSGRVPGRGRGFANGYRHEPRRSPSST